jgi:hypothetical protein
MTVHSDAPQLFEIVEERYFSPHHLLLRTAGVALHEAHRTVYTYSAPMRESHTMSAILMSALSVEALCNAIGFRLIEGWEDYEQSKPWMKLRVLCKELHLPFDKGAEPWQSLKDLLEFRNKVAHGKSKWLKRVRSGLDQAALDAALAKHEPSGPPAEWEAKLTLVEAGKAVALARRVETLLTDALPEDLKLGIVVEGWIMKTQEIGVAGNQSPAT